MAAVLAVKACVQSAPYDIPLWLGPLLVGLLRAAKAPQPLRSIVRCAHPCHPGNVMLRCPDAACGWSGLSTVVGCQPQELKTPSWAPLFLWHVLACMSAQAEQVR